jgi:hypothetical protein
MIMAIIAIIGAFTFGFVLSSLFAVGAAADRSDRPRRDDEDDFLEVALLRALLHPRPVRHPDTDPRVSSSSTRLQGSFRRRRSASSAYQHTRRA